MFIGKYYHSLEAKGRLSLPKRFRDKSDQWIITRGLDGGLFLFTQLEFTNHIRSLSEGSLTKKRHRDYLRIMTNEAAEVEPDANGRVHLPEYLIEFAKLQKQVVIVGSSSYIEIWDRDQYHSYIETIESNAANIAESLQSEQNI
ncbi:MAG: division/cell wall cluster transcriptional repressor MraZ [Microgenomates group bacterium]